MSHSAKKKRNHYVPQFVLRNFSPDGRTIAIFLLSTGKHIIAASLRDQCYADYFYGKDPEIEDRFAAQENRIASLLLPADPAKLECLGAPELTDIKTFVFEQRQRTLAAARGVYQLNASMMGYLRREGFGISDDDRQAFEEEQRAPQRFLLKAAAEMAPLISDLEVKFLMPSITARLNKRRPPPVFVISDAPVAGYNQWAEQHPKFSNYSGYTTQSLV